jgi:hypothetical protein
LAGGRLSASRPGPNGEGGEKLGLMPSGDRKEALIRAGGGFLRFKQEISPLRALVARFGRNDGGAALRAVKKANGLAGGAEKRGNKRKDFYLKLSALIIFNSDSLSLKARAIYFCI